MTGKQMLVVRGNQYILAPKPQPKSYGAREVLLLHILFPFPLILTLTHHLIVELPYFLVAFGAASPSCTYPYTMGSRRPPLTSNQYRQICRGQIL